MGIGGIELAVVDAEGAPGAAILCRELRLGLPPRPLLDPPWSLSTDAITMAGRTITLPLDDGTASATVPFADAEPIVNGRATWSADGAADTIGIGCLHGDHWLIGIVAPSQSMWAVLRWDLTPDAGAEAITLEAFHPVLVTSPMLLETRCGLTVEGHPTVAGTAGVMVEGSYTATDLTSTGAEAVMLFTIGTAGMVTFDHVMVVRPWVG